MGSFSFWHILILAIIILLLFGGNRFSAMMGDVAKGLKSFKQGMSEDDKPEERRDPRSLPRSSDRPIAKSLCRPGRCSASTHPS
jgi:sec-independent protein translocase protein TatA